MTKKFAATLLTATALAAIPAAVTPAARADVCGDVGGPFLNVAGCTNVARDLAIPAEVAVADEWARYGFPVGYPYSLVPAFPGEAPCISPTGLRYYTPGTAPCYLP